MALLSANRISAEIFVCLLLKMLATTWRLSTLVDATNKAVYAYKPLLPHRDAVALRRLTVCSLHDVLFQVFRRLNGTGLHGASCVHKRISRVYNLRLVQTSLRSVSRVIR